MTELTPIAASFGGVLIGLAAVLLMVTTCRIAGVSGFVSRLLPPFEDDQLAVRLAFVAGLVAAPVLIALAGMGDIATAVTADERLLVGGGLLALARLSAADVRAVMASAAWRDCRLDPSSRRPCSW